MRFTDGKNSGEITLMTLFLNVGRRSILGGRFFHSQVAHEFVLANAAHWLSVHT
jgi:hypothetical protein